MSQTSSETATQWLAYIMIIFPVVVVIAVVTSLCLKRKCGHASTVEPTEENNMDQSSMEKEKGRDDHIFATENECLTSQSIASPVNNNYNNNIDADSSGKEGPHNDNAVPSETTKTTSPSMTPVCTTQCTFVSECSHEWELDVGNCSRAASASTSPVRTPDDLLISMFRESSNISNHRHTSEGCAGDHAPQSDRNESPVVSPGDLMFTMFRQVSDVSVPRYDDEERDKETGLKDGEGELGDTWRNATTSGIVPGDLMFRECSNADEIRIQVEQCQVKDIDSDTRKDSELDRSDTKDVIISDGDIIKPTTKNEFSFSTLMTDTSVTPLVGNVSDGFRENSMNNFLETDTEDEEDLLSNGVSEEDEEETTGSDGNRQARENDTSNPMTDSAFEADGGGEPVTVESGCQFVSNKGDTRKKSIASTATVEIGEKKLEPSLTPINV